jgi:hypothetical protein
VERLGVAAHVTLLWASQRLRAKRTHVPVPGAPLPHGRDGPHPPRLPSSVFRLRLFGDNLRLHVPSTCGAPCEVNDAAVHVRYTDRVATDYTASVFFSGQGNGDIVFGSIFT